MYNIARIQDGLICLGSPKYIRGWRYEKKKYALLDAWKLYHKVPPRRYIFLGDTSFLVKCPTSQLL